MTPEEEDHLQQLAKALQAVTRWETNVVAVRDGGWEAAPGSELDADDKLAHPFTVSSAAWSAILASISHLGTLRDSLFQFTGQTNVRAKIHTHGQLSLVRGALENASLGYGLLQPDQSIKRITRRIQEDWDEVKQLESVKTLVNTPTLKTMQQREQEFRDLLTRVGGDPTHLKCRPGYGDIVKAVARTHPTGETAAFVVWKACSSIAHGELRGQLAFLKTEQVHPAGAGMAIAQTTANIQLMTTGALIAIATTRSALHLYAKRAGTMIQI